VPRHAAAERDPSDTIFAETRTGPNAVGGIAGS